MQWYLTHFPSYVHQFIGGFSIGLHPGNTLDHRNNMCGLHKMRSRQSTRLVDGFRIFRPAKFTERSTVSLM
jgi:hypothetical protein